MKFNCLLRKELRDMLNRQTIITMVITFVLLTVAGQSISSMVSNSSKESQDIVICDLDKTTFSTNVMNEIKKTTEANKGKFTSVEVKSDNYTSEMKRLNVSSCVIIPAGFEKSVQERKKADMKFVQVMTSLSTISNLNTGSESALALIQQAVKSAVYSEKITANQMTKDEMSLLEDPVNVKETTVIGNKSDNISSSMIVSICSAQGMVVPIIMLVLIMLSAQMIVSAISTEKIDKTLETLLSAPVSRISVLTAKMLSAGVVAALQAVVYMIGMKKMTGGLTETISANSGQYQDALKNLGLNMGVGQYVLVGVQMFLSILIALSVALVLGALAKDAKSAQTMVLPITLACLIPYMLSMMVDIKSVTPVVKYIVYAIPFTHTFMASENVMFGDYTLYIIGAVYQLIFLAVCMTIALKVFMSDRILTMSIGGGSKKSKKKGGMFQFKM